MIVSVADNWQAVEKFYASKILIGFKGKLKKKSNKLPESMRAMITAKADDIIMGSVDTLRCIAKIYDFIADNHAEAEALDFFNSLNKLFSSDFFITSAGLEYLSYTKDEDRKNFLEDIIALPEHAEYAGKTQPDEMKKKVVGIVWDWIRIDNSVSIGSLFNEEFRNYVKKVSLLGIHNRVFKFFNYEGVFYPVAYELFDQLNISVCPYCNLSFVSHVENRLGKARRPQFDHFYPKAVYPVLSLSLYNLIPSCAECNYIKGEDVLLDVEHFHPLKNAEVSFYAKQPWLAKWYRPNHKLVRDGIKLGIVPCPEEKSLDSLFLKERYEKMQSEAVEILGSMFYVKESMIRKLHPHRKIWRRIAMRGVNDGNYKRRIMGKMILDLAKVAKI